MHFSLKNKKIDSFKKTCASIFLGFIIFTGLLSVSYRMAQAQTNGNLQDYTVLAPLPGTTEDTTCDATSDFCLATLFGTHGYLQGIFNLAIGVGAVTAFVLITLYGFEYMFSDSLNIKTAAKESLLNVTWGLGIVLFAYVILFTVHSTLVNNSLNFTSPTLNPAITLGALDTANQQLYLAANIQDLNNEQPVRNTLMADGIVVNNAPCTSPTQTGCTDVGGLTNNTLGQVEALTANCPTCIPITITGGNEPNGHDAAGYHSSGNAVDIAPNATLDTYLQNNTTPPIPTSPVIGTPYTTTLNGQQVTILYEANGTVSGGSTSSGSHVHITFTGN